MESTEQKKCIIVFFMLAFTSVMLAVINKIDMPAESGITAPLPLTPGEWIGHNVLHCQNDQCSKTYFKNDIKSVYRCPECGSPLDQLSYGEKATLPADTTIMKKAYSHPQYPLVTCSVVIMGSDRTSIHRPEGCLVGQGFSVINERSMDVPLSRGDKLVVTVLDLIPPSSPKNKLDTERMKYIYWFVAPGQTTHKRGEMQIRMARDRIFRNSAPRWAYISMFTSISTCDYLKDLIRDIHEGITGAGHPNNAEKAEVEAHE